MTILSIKETCIYVEDLERTKDFYSGKLGLAPISFVQTRHVFFRAGSSVLLCFLADVTKKERELPPHGASGKIHFAFEINREDYPQALIQIKEAALKYYMNTHGKMVSIRFTFTIPTIMLLRLLNKAFGNCIPDPSVTTTFKTVRHSLCVYNLVTIITDLKLNTMAEIHVQARKHSRSNPSWMWTWLIIGIIIIAAVVYYVYANKDKADDTTNDQKLENQRNTPMPGAAVPHQLDKTYVIRVA